MLSIPLIAKIMSSEPSKGEEESSIIMKEILNHEDQIINDWLMVSSDNNGMSDAVEVSEIYISRWATIDTTVGMHQSPQPLHVLSGDMRGIDLVSIKFRTLLYSNGCVGVFYDDAGEYSVILCIDATTLKQIKSIVKSAEAPSSEAS
jgi:hypothetical protein